MADLDPLRWLNPSLSVHSTPTCDVIGMEKLNGSVQPGQDLGDTHPESHGAGAVFQGGQGGEQTAIFLTRVCGAERRSSLILTSNSVLWQTELLQSVAA